MHLDARTLFFVHSLVSITLAMLMTVFWRGHRGIPGLGHWALSSVLAAGGYLCVGLRGVVPDFVAIVVARGLIALSLVILWNGIRRFDGRPTKWIAPALAVGALMLFLVERTYVTDDAGSRIAVISAVFSLGCLICASELIRFPRRGLHEPALTAAVMFGLMALSLAVRAAMALSLPPGSSILASIPEQTSALMLTTVGGIVIFVAGMMMAAQRLQNEIEARNADLNTARIDAEQASRAKSEFLATMSHELRTPLNAIIGFSEILCRGLFGPLGHPRYREYVGDIHNAGKHLLDVITTILDISKAEAGKLEVNVIDLDPALVLDTTLPLIRTLADEKRIGIVIDAPRAPLACRADPQALKQILLNLLSNAVKFTGEGGTVTVRLHRPMADQVEIAVSDTGIGIAAKDLPRLMKPFEQAGQGYARQHSGTGLGLPLVDSLVRLHGGTLRVESAVDVGTTITVRLPAPPSASVAAA
jgi:signal transduction histidine kinase